MDNLAIYRNIIGCYYGKASYKSAIGRLLRNANPFHPYRSVNQTQLKFKHRKSFSNHRLKGLRYRSRFALYQFNVLPMLVILLTTTINQYGFLCDETRANIHTLPAGNYQMLPQVERPAYHFEDKLFYTQKIKDIADRFCEHYIEPLTFSMFSDENTSYIYNHTHTDSEYNECKKYIDLYSELYPSRMFLTQYMFSGSMFVSYHWQHDTVDQAGSNSFPTKNHTTALTSNYECSKHGTGTCYYLLGNKGMHMSNGNPQTKSSTGEAHLTERSLSLIENRAQNSVGYITINDVSGTGFRVCDTYLMTAFHVFFDKIDGLVDHILFQLGILGDNRMDVVLSKVKDSLEVDINVDGAGDFESKARRMLMSFLEHTAYDTEKLVTRLKDIIDTVPLLTRLREDWKNCLVDFISHGRFYVDWKIIFGNEEIDIIIVDLYPTETYQNYPRGMLLDERYRQHGGIQLIRYIHRYPTEIIIDQTCKVFNSDKKLLRAVEKAIEWWSRNFPEENETFFRDGYKDCCKAIDKKTGRVILTSSESFIKGSSGSPVIYMMNKEGVPVVEMIYQGGFPPFYYKGNRQRFQNVDRKCFFGRATSMKKLAEVLIEFKKTALKRELFGSECFYDCQDFKRLEAMTENLKIWEEEDRYFYETKVSKIILNRISDDKYPSVSVMGVPGSGKTAAIRHAALYLQNEKGFTIYPIFEPRKFYKRFYDYFKRNTKQVFVFDDPVGCYNIDIDLLKLWDDHNESIANCLNKHTKFLFSVRTQLGQHNLLKYNSYIFNMKTRVIDLMSQTCSLDIDEMKGMLRFLLNAKELPFRENTLSSVAIGRNDAISRSFPLLCKVFCQQPTLRENPTHFFKNPFSALVQIFKKIEQFNKHQFCGLLMCAVLQDKSIGLTPLNSDITELETKSLRNAVLCEMSLTENDLKMVHQELEAIDNVFVKQIGPNTNFIHYIFRDIVLFLNNNPEFVFKYGSSQLIKERVRINDPLPNDDQFVLVFKGDHFFSSLADRLIQDFWKNPTSGFSWIANNYLIDDNRLFADIENRLLSKYSFVEKMKENRLLILNVTVFSGNMKLTQHLLEKLGNISDARLILHSACRAPSNNFKLIVLLVEHGALFNQLTSNSESVLHYITRYTNESNVEVIDYFLQKRISVKTLNNQNESVLHYTAKYGGRNVKKLAELLIQNGACLNIQNEKGESILHYSVSYETEVSVQLAELFIQHGARVNAVDKDGLSLLHYTARYKGENNMQLANLFIQNGASVDVVDNYGQSLLHYTARYNTEQSVKLAQLFIQHKASVNVVDDEGQSLLHYTARYNTEQSVNLAELFIQHKASINVVDKEDRSLLHYTASYNTEHSVKLANLFIGRGASVNVVDKDGQSLLNYAARYKSDNNMKLAEIFIHHKASVNIMDNAMQSLLHYTARYKGENNVQLAELIIQHGASVEVVDKDGQSLLHYTAYYEGENNVQLAELFIKYGASVNAVNKDKQSLLHYTVCYEGDNNVQLAELFIRHEAAVNVVDNEGQSLLHYTLLYKGKNNMKLTELFIHKGASVNVVDKEDRSLLHYTASYNKENNVKLAELFINRGASVKVVDTNGQSLLHYTARYKGENNVQLAELFIQHGASVNVVDDEGQSLLHYIARYEGENNIKLAELFIHHEALTNVVDKKEQSIQQYTSHYEEDSSMEQAEICKHNDALVNVVDKEGLSVLHYISRYQIEKNVQLAELFIHHGASVNVVDKEGLHLLHYTAYYEGKNNVKLAELFIQHGASVNVVDKNGQSLLHYAAYYEGKNSVKLAELFIRHKASVNVLDKETQSLLHYTVYYEGKNNVQLAELFVRHGASVNVVDKEGQSLLHHTARSKGENSVKLTDLFIHHGAAVNGVD